MVESYFQICDVLRHLELLLDWFRVKFFRQCLGPGYNPFGLCLQDKDDQTKLGVNLTKPPIFLLCNSHLPPAQRSLGWDPYHFLSSTGIHAPATALRPPSATMAEVTIRAAEQTCALIDALVFVFEHPEPKLLSNSVNQLQFCSSLCILHILFKLLI